MVWPLIAAAAISAGSSIFGGRRQQAATNARNAAQDSINWDMYHGTNNFNREQAQIDRDWNAQQSGIARDWNAQQAGIERTFNAQEAATNRDFQERMSNTQYQRGTKDMMAAGINPMLAVSQGGAGNVSGSSASTSAPQTSAASGSPARGTSGSAGGSGHFENYLASGMNGALSTMTALNNAQFVNAQTEQAKAGTLSTIADIERIKSQSDLNSADKARLDQMVKEAQFNWSKGWPQTKSEEEANKSYYERHISQEKAAQAGVETKYQKYQEPKLKGEAEFQQMLNEMMKGGTGTASGIERFLKMLLPVIMRR